MTTYDEIRARCEAENFNNALDDVITLLNANNTDFLDEECHQFIEDIWDNDRPEKLTLYANSATIFLIQAIRMAVEESESNPDMKDEEGENTAILSCGECGDVKTKPNLSHMGTVDAFCPHTGQSLLVDETHDKVLEKLSQIGLPPWCPKLKKESEPKCQ